MAPQMAYDRGITVFSPDGRLFQVEYAREAVKRGTTAVGIKARDGITLLVDKRIGSKLLEATSIEKIFQIDEHIAAATSGLVADARVLTDRARVEAHVSRIAYDEPIDIEDITKKVCDYKQTCTQFGGLRPFGTAVLIGGVDDSPRLFETDPSGALLEYKATGIGAGRSEVMEIFEKRYKDDIDLESAILLGLEALNKVTEGKISVTSLDACTVDVKTKSFRALTPEEIKEYTDKLSE